MKAKKKSIPAILLATALGLMASEATIVVNSLLDPAIPETGQTTLRTALAAATSGETIVFDPVLDGATIELSIVGAEHTVLVGEVMGFDIENNISFLVGYHERDYGRSALYTTNDIVIDASALTNGITIKWMGGDADPARVLAVYGNLTMNNVSITGGRCVSTTNVVSVGGYDQASTRARGGGLAVWGVAHLENCRIYNNACSAAVMDPGRDAGIFGGGIYADIVEISDCIISGNRLAATGVSGGGIFTVGGANASETVSTVECSSITGNRIAGIFAYGGGGLFGWRRHREPQNPGTDELHGCRQPCGNRRSRLSIWQWLLARCSGLHVERAHGNPRLHHCGKPDPRRTPHQ